MPSSTVGGPQAHTLPIEEIQLGQRVAGRNPLRKEAQTPSQITPKSWRAVRLTMDYHGVRYDLAFLRSLDWIDASGAEPGGTIHLQLPEMGLDGPALVESISACPPIEPDDGTGRMVVTGTMRHLAGNVLDLHITGLDEPLGVTDTHPIWSETRHTFVTAGQLKAGEQLRSETGTVGVELQPYFQRKNVEPPAVRDDCSQADAPDRALSVIRTRVALPASPCCGGGHRRHAP